MKPLSPEVREMLANAPKVLQRIETPARHSPQCEAEVSDATQRWREHCGKGYQCELVARFTFKGRPLCRRHAGDAVIAYILEGQER